MTDRQTVAQIEFRLSHSGSPEGPSACLKSEVRNRFHALADPCARYMCTHRPAAIDGPCHRAWNEGHDLAWMRGKGLGDRRYQFYSCELVFFLAEDSPSHLHHGSPMGLGRRGLKTLGGGRLGRDLSGSGRLGGALHDARVWCSRV